MEEGIYSDISSEEYHGAKNTYSSSQLKDILSDPELFHKKYITKEMEKEETAAFDVGTYFHTAILEPHKVKTECAVFDGIRRGEKWEKFKEDNKQKAIITKSEFETATNLIEAVRNSPRAMELIEATEKEVSAFVNVRVSHGQVYHVKEGLILRQTGWEKTRLVPKEGTDLTIKVRADALGDGFVLDLKSTSGNAKDNRLMRGVVSKYKYDLSAALYLDVFTVASGVVHETFYWTFASKEYRNSRTYEASQKNIFVGRSKYKKALVELAKYIENNWTFEDEIETLDPEFYEKEWLETQDGDLL